MDERRGPAAERPERRSDEGRLERAAIGPGEQQLRDAIQRARALPVATPHLQLLRVCLRLAQQELVAVTFELGIDYDAIPGDTLADKARALITATRRHGGEAWLLQAIRRHRADLRPELDELEEIFG